MRCPTLSQIPPPPPGQTGWPWTEETPQLPDRLPDGHAWPAISIVTPNFNYGRFLEETVRSILLQGYPNLEFLVIDGGSTDGSVDVIRKYEKHLSFWSSEPDQGQAHAINKGFVRVTGDLVNWINSDDLLLPNALRRVAETSVKHPGTIVLGDVEEFLADTGRSWIVQAQNVSFINLVHQLNRPVRWHQAGTFVPRSLYAKVGLLDEGLRYAFDNDWMYRLLEGGAVSYVGAPVTRFRIHGAEKTNAEYPAALWEYYTVLQRYWGADPDLDKRYVRALLEVREAAFYLGEHPNYARFWNRLRGIRLLLSTWVRCPRIVLRPLFRHLCIRAILPKRLHRSGPWQNREAV